jgi:predicted enzyme related to lactoylglutathione lyase
MQRPDRLFRPAVIACALGAAVPAMAAAPSMPPIMSPPSQDHHPGKGIFFQLVTPDIAADKTFYGSLFGWQFQDVAGTREPYAMAFLDGHLVAGIAQRAVPPGQHKQSAWLSFISATDVPATVAAATSGGGRVLAPPRTVPGLGTEAVLADPQGAVFGVMNSASGDPPDTLKPAGAWIWRSLLTTNAVTDTAFYHALFGYQTYTLPAPAGEQHILLATEAFARATANTLPANRPNMHPHWLSYIRVADAHQAAAKAEALGGRILLAPYPDRHGGMIAVVADPEGAPIGLFEWADTETKALSK